MAFGLSSADAFDAILYGPQHPSTDAYLRQNLAAATSNLTQAGMEWMQRAQAMYDAQHSAQALMLARAALQQVGAHLAPDVILYLHQLAELQQAQFVMQRWIMANEMLRSMAILQRLDGYGADWTQVNDVGRNNNDWCQVMNGHVVFSEDPTEPTSWTQYSHELSKDDAPLNHMQRRDILQTWDVAEHLVIHTDHDPTSPLGAKR